MQLHLDEISRHVAMARTPSCCSTAPDGIRPESSMCGKHHPDLAAFRSPELNPVENVCNICAPTGSRTASSNYDDIIDAACDAWRRLIAQHRRSPQSECEIGRI